LKFAADYILSAVLEPLCAVSALQDKPSTKARICQMLLQTLNLSGANQPWKPF
jgi:hypothetical protein